MSFLTDHLLCSYVDQATALAQNLTFVSSDTIVMRADYKTVLSPSGPGRNSVRIMTNKQYTTAVTIINLRHMPQGCASVLCTLVCTPS